MLKDDETATDRAAAKYRRSGGEKEMERWTKSEGGRGRHGC